MKTFKFCPNCKNHLDKKGDHIKCSVCKMVIYKNSNPTASILPIKKGKVLLTERAIEPYKGEYDIIGGFLKYGEHPEDGVVREAHEETGLRVKPTKLLGIYIDRYGKGGNYTLNIIYIGKVIGGNMKAQDDVASLHWFDLDKLPTINSFQNSKDALRDLQKELK